VGLEGVFTDLFRPRGNHHQRVTTFELFFDLVYVLAVTQLSHLLLSHLSWHGTYRTLLLAFAVWWAWMYTAWVTNWLDPDKRPVRIALIAFMLFSLVMSAMIPQAFGDRGLAFAAAFVALQVLRTAFMLLASRHDRILRLNFKRILIWMLVSAVPWLLGGIAEGSTRDLIWTIAVLYDLCGPVSGYIVPGLGRSTTRDWASISGGHMAERCHLFLMLSLGESILVTGATISDLEIDLWTAAAFVVAFLGSVALWWIYFDRSAEDSLEIIAESDDPGRLARFAYVYLHFPIVCGVITAAVGDELAIAYPTGEASIELRLVTYGGAALYLLGHFLFKRMVWGVISVQRLIAIGVLLAMIPMGAALSPLANGVIAVLTLIGVAVADSLSSIPAAERRGTIRRDAVRAPEDAG